MNSLNAICCLPQLGMGGWWLVLVWLQGETKKSDARSAHNHRTRGFKSRPCHAIHRDEHTSCRQVAVMWCCAVYLFLLSSVTNRYPLVNAPIRDDRLLGTPLETLLKRITDVDSSQKSNDAHATVVGVGKAGKSSCFPQLVRFFFFLPVPHFPAGLDVPSPYLFLD